ncbi:MAG: carbohydrate kinase [Verrucomicrobiota bacterium]|jgi:fructokinase
MKPKVIGIGEVLWDLLPSGKQLGGAPANFAYHARALGADAWILSRVGEDSDGLEIIHRLQQLGVSTKGLEIDPAAPTGTVSVEVAPDGQPRFTIHENVAWDRLAGEENARRLVAQADAVCFGTLAQRSERSRAAIQKLVSSSRQDALRILDVNLRQHFFSRDVLEQSLTLANVTKVNEAELPQVADFFGIGGNGATQLAELAHRFQLKAAACTRGGNGSILISHGRVSEHPGVSTRVVDTVGAGDAFTAAMTLGLLAGWELDVINERANRLAAFVASCAGATPLLPSELRAAFASNESRDISSTSSQKS